MQRRIRSIPGDAVALAAVVILALALTSPKWHGAPRADYDSLFYEAQSLQLRGKSEAESLRAVANGPIAASLKRSEARNPDTAARAGDPAWIDYASRFYRRRWTVPAMAAAIEPAAGDRSLVDVALLGYVLFGVLLYALLRRRFSPAVAGAVSGACLLLPALRDWSFAPLTDSWGLALQCGALLAAVLALEREGWRWLALLAASVLALAFTRDATVLIVIATGAVALLTRTRRSAAVLATAVAASIPAPLLFGASFKEQLAFDFNDFGIPKDTSWSFVLHHWPGALRNTLDNDALQLGRGSYGLAFVAAGLFALLAVALVRAAVTRRDPFFVLVAASLVGCVVMVVLAPNYTHLRLELVFVPALAAGGALVAERAVALVAARRRAAVRPAPA